MGGPLRASIRSLRRRLDDILLYVSLQAVLALLRLLPSMLARACARRLGAMVFRLSGRDRRRAIQQLRDVLGLSEPQARTQAIELFRRLGEGVIELLHLPVRDQRLEVSVQVEGLEHLEAARAQGRGVIWITGHIGNWELMAMKVAALGIPVHVVARRLRYPRLERMLLRFRMSHGVRVLSRGEDTSIDALCAVLRDGGVLGLLIDQDLEVPGMMVPFLGRPAHTASGAALLALESGAPVITGFIRRVAPFRHIVQIGPAIDGLPGREMRVAGLELLTRANARISREIQERPADWPWFHARWRRHRGLATELEGEGAWPVGTGARGAGGRP